MCHPADGVYAGWYLRPDGSIHACAINLGRRPTFYEHADHSLLEAHLLDFNDDLYGEPARVRFQAFLRSERKFEGIDALGGPAQARRRVDPPGPRRLTARRRGPDESAMADHLIAPPDTPLAREAGALLDAECDRELAGHCRRSYQFAALIARAEAVEVDEEVLYLGTLLHDLGLARRYDGPERFDVRGANVVRALLLDHGMERARAENVWDVIALHAAGAIAQHKSPETRIANRGISVDVRGVGRRRPADRRGAGSARRVAAAGLPERVHPPARRRGARAPRHRPLQLVGERRRGPRARVRGRRLPGRPPGVRAVRVARAHPVGQTTFPSGP